MKMALQDPKLFDITGKKNVIKKININNNKSDQR